MTRPRFWFQRVATAGTDAGWTQHGAAPWLMLVSLILLGTATRLFFRDVPNFAPVAALALFAGYYFRSAWLALSVPLGIMLLSDQFLGGYDPRMMVLVYGMLALPVVWRALLRRWLPVDGERPARVAVAVAGLIGCSLMSSVLFFVVTNFGCWLTMGAYEKSFAGLVHCYGQALPFFRYTLLGDLVFASAGFSAFALLTQWQLLRAGQRLAASR